MKNKEVKVKLKVESKSESEMTGVELMQQMVNVDEDDDDEVFMKSHLLSRVDWSFPLHFYDKGILMFFDEKDALFGDKVLISMFTEGIAKEHSEKMGIDMEKHFRVDEYTLLPKSTIKHFEISQNTCPNPDCDACKENDIPPASLVIFTESKPIHIFFNTQAEALEVMIIFNSFKEGKLSEFIKTPFQDGYNKRFK